MCIIKTFKEHFFPQHKVKRLLNRYIKKKHFSGWWGIYYTWIRDKYAVKYGVEIGVETVIGGLVEFPHPRNIVIGEKVRIGKNFTIFNNVTIGQKNGQYPIIGDNVTVYPGSVLIGGIKIGNNVVIGANSFVNKDIDSDVIVAGNPVRVIKKREGK